MGRLLEGLCVHQLDEAYVHRGLFIPIDGALQKTRRQRKSQGVSENPFLL